MAWKNKVAKGFNTTDIPLEFCLLQGEIAEAFDAWRKGRADVGEELADVAIYLLGLDAPYDWQGAPLPAPSDVAALARDLMAAGLDAGRAAVLRDGADRAATAWEGIAGRLVSARAQFGQYLPDWHPWEDYRASYSGRADLGGGALLQ